MATVRDWSKYQPNHQASDEGSCGRSSSVSKGPPSYAVSQHADRDRPSQHAPWGRVEDAVSRDGDACGNDVNPQGHSSPGLVHRQRDTEQAQSEQQSEADGQNHDPGIDQ